MLKKKVNGGKKRHGKDEYNMGAKRPEERREALSQALE